MRPELPWRAAMRVRLTRKLADRIDDVDLTGRGVGDVLNLTDLEAELLIAEGWAVPLPDTSHATHRERAKAADSPRRRRQPR